MNIPDRDEIQKWPLTRKVSTFRSGSVVLPKALKRYPRRMWNFTTKPGKNWCIREVLWHLADSEVHAYVRLRQALAEPGSVLAVWNQEKWGSTPTAQKLDADQALEVFLTLRRANAAFLRWVPKKAFGNRVQHPQFGFRTLESMVGMNIWHVLNHIGQMERRYNEWQSRKA